MITRVAEMDKISIYGALLLFILSIATLINVGISRVVFSHYAPNWSHAISSLPAPNNMRKRNSWKVAYIRDNPHKMLLRCMVNMNDDGILLRPYLEHVYLGGIFCNYRTMFIPWAAFVNPRVALVRKTSCSSLIRSNPVEFTITGQHFTVVLATSDIKTVFCASCGDPATYDNPSDEESNPTNRVGKRG
jgi:hypothetical protein